MSAQVDAPTVLYKAVSPDGTSFYDDRTRWVVGEVTSHPAPTTVGAGNARGYLSVADVPTDCTGFKWPCQLLAVEPVGEVWQPDHKHFPHKWAGHGFLVVEELPAYQAFGPQGEQVVALLERAGTLTYRETNSLIAAWAAAWGGAQNATWAAAWDAAGNAARTAGRGAAWNAAQHATRGAGQGATWDAVALLVRDLIPADDYDTLTLPWRRIIGRIHPDDPEVESW